MRLKLLVCVASTGVKSPLNAILEQTKTRRPAVSPDEWICPGSYECRLRSGTLPFGFRDRARQTSSRRQEIQHIPPTRFLRFSSRATSSHIGLGGEIRHLEGDPRPASQKGPRTNNSLLQYSPLHPIRESEIGSIVQLNACAPLSTSIRN